MSDKALGKRRDRSPSRNREHRGYSNPTPTHEHSRSSARTEDNQTQRHRGPSPRRGSPTRRLAPTLTYQHPWGYRHQSGCRRCDDFSEHVREEARDRHDFAQVVVEASLSDPPDVVRRRYEEARDQVEDLERELDKRDRQIDEERDRATRMSRAMQDRDQAALRDSNIISDLRRQLSSRPNLEPVPPRHHAPSNVSEEHLRRLQEENAALRHNLALSSQQIREDNQRILNLHGQLEEILCFVLHNGHSVAATSGNSGTQPLPRPYFLISSCDTNPGRYTVPLPRDEDEKMEDGGNEPPVAPNESSTAKRGLEDIAYIPSSEGHLVQLYRDPYEQVEYEDNSDDNGDDEGDDSTDSDAGNHPDSGPRIGVQLRARSRSPIAIVVPESPPTPVTRASEKYLKARPGSGHRTAEPQQRGNNSVAPVTETLKWNNSGSWADAHDHAGWADEPPRWSEVAQRRPTAPTPPVASSSRINPAPIPSSSRTPSMTERPTPSAPRAMSSRGGRDRTMATTNHGPFNGIPWVAKRFASIPMPYGVSPAERNRILREAGRNVERGPLGKGQIPPRFEEAYVKNIDILRNLVERAQHPDHPGARDAVDILGELLNAASRAPKKSRHELEEFIISNYTGRPQWAKDESFHGRFGRKKKTVGPPQDAVMHETDPTASPTNAGKNLVDQDVHMSPAPDGASDAKVAEAPPKPAPGPMTSSSAPGPEDTDMRDPEIPQRPLETPIETRNESGISASGPPTTVHSTNFSRGNSPDRVRQWVPLDRTDTEEADRILEELDDDVECPLYTPLYERWELLLKENPGFHVFGIPLNTTTTQYQLILHGFLSILNRLPHPQSWSGVLRLMTLIHQRWTTEPQFIPVRDLLNVVPVPYEFGVDNDEEILQHLAEHGIRPTEVPGVEALFNYILEGLNHAAESV